MDLLNNEIVIGDFVAYPDGAKFYTGIVKKIGRDTATIECCNDYNWYGDRLFKKRKKQHLCIILNEEQLRIHELNEFMRAYPNGIKEVRRIHQEREQVTAVDFVDKRMKLLRQMCELLKGNNEFEGFQEFAPTQEEHDLLMTLIQRK